MQRQRDGELVPIAEAFSDLSGPVAALRDASPQARYHFTQADQVNQLVSASEADPDRGFMARLMALCSLPRSNPGNRLQVQAQLTVINSALGSRPLRPTPRAVPRAPPRFARTSPRNIETSHEPVRRQHNR